MCQKAKKYRVTNGNEWVNNIISNILISPNNYILHNNFNVS